MVGGREIAVIVRTFGEINVFSIFFLNTFNGRKPTF